MSIIANYLRLPAENLPKLSSDPDAFKSYVAVSSGTERHFDLDQFWDALAWLLSPSARERAVITYQWLLLAEGEIEDVPANASTISTDDMELAFKGGSDKLHPKIDFGYGPASIIDTSSLSRIADALASVSDEQLVNSLGYRRGLFQLTMHGTEKDRNPVITPCLDWVACIPPVD